MQINQCKITIFCLYFLIAKSVVIACISAGHVFGLSILKSTVLAASPQVRHLLVLDSMSGSARVQSTGMNLANSFLN